MSYINQRVIAVLMSTLSDNKQTTVATLLALHFILKVLVQIQPS